MFQGVLSSKLRCVSKNNPVSQFQCLTSLSKKASRAWQLNFAHQMQTRMHLGILSPIHLVIGKSKNYQKCDVSCNYSPTDRNSFLKLLEENKLAKSPLGGN